MANRKTAAPGTDTENTHLVNSAANQIVITFFDSPVTKRRSAGHPKDGRWNSPRKSGSSLSEPNAPAKALQACEKRPRSLARLNSDGVRRRLFFGTGP